MEPSDRPKVKQRDRAASEEKLLNAAEAVFSKHGFNGATSREIAKKAGLNEALIARYFEGKFGLLLALVQRLIEEDLKDVKYPEQSTLEAELAEFVCHHMKRGFEKPEFFRIILSQALTDAKFLKRLREAVPKKFSNPTLTARVERFKASGQLRKDVDVQMLLEDLSLYERGVTVFEGILSARPFEECKAQMLTHISYVARGLKP